MKNKILFSILLISIAMTSTLNAQQAKSFYDYKVLDINGKPYDLSQLKGKKILVVNTASKCGNTPQYSDLEKLYNEYKGKNFVIIGFPANDFMGQEPGTNEEIKAFCTANYGVTFPLMSKISVRGKDMDPLYKWLTTKELNGVMDSQVSWNFQKYLIDEKGQLVDMASPKEKPYSDKIVDWLKN
jgi:glutathione peroxidase